MAIDASKSRGLLTPSASATFLRPRSPFATGEVMGEPRASIPDRFNAAAFFVDRQVVEGRAGRPAFQQENRVVTYREIFESVNRVGNALLDLGVQMEDRVLLILLDGPEFVASFFGAMKLGAVPVPVNTLMRAADYRFFLDDSRAKVAVVSEPLLLEAGPALVQAKHLKHVVVVGGAKSHHLQFESWASKASRSLEPADTSKDDVAFWLYSSGSTGVPQGALHLHHDMVVCSDTYGLQVLGITERDRTFSAAKLFFAYGLGNNMYFPMRVGAEAVLYSGRPTAEAVFQVLERYRPTLFFGVATLYASMLQMQDAEDRFDLSSLRLCVSAGEALPADVYRRWVRRFDVELLDGIGTTEILHIFLSNRPGRVKPGSSGTPVPGYEAIIVDEAV